MSPSLDSLFAFVDPKDPFTMSDLVGEEQPGPILSLMAARTFAALFLFHTPQLREKALATSKEVGRKHPGCRVTIRELSVTDPKDYSSVMGSLAKEIRGLSGRDSGGGSYVCVSSGTAEMRAAWFLLTALGMLPAKLLQVGSPAEPLFGAPNVQEVHFDVGNWSRLKDLAMPMEFFAAFDRQIRRAPVLLDEAPTGLGGLHDPQPLPIAGLDKALQDLGIFIGSAIVREAAERACIAADSPLPVLLLGETGTGKERFAELIHKLSPRRGKDMIAINCAAIPKEIAESYLFGHVKGAFTGADTDKKGIFEEADQTTLFLDEVAELTLEVQAKMLRVIQDGCLQRLGSAAQRKIATRIIAATNRDLNKEIAGGRFRKDLYFRLEVVQISLPSLRERRNEIAGLALALIKQINQRRHRPRQLTKDALQRLERYHWPGNVRQLSNVLERSVLYARTDILAADDLLISDQACSEDPLASLPDPMPGFSVETYLAQVRKQLFLRALAKCNGNQTEAAALLGVSKQAVSKFVSGETSTPVDGQ